MNHPHSGKDDHKSAWVTRWQPSARIPASWLGRAGLWLLGLGSLLWLLARSGLNPRRLAYPCQRAALVNSLAFLAYLGGLLGLDQLRRGLRRSSGRPALTTTSSLVLLALLAALLTGSQKPAIPASAKIAALPGWVSPSAISNVFAAENIPAPVCSLDGGALPASGPCHTPSVALADAGVDALLNEMETRGDYFYRTASHPTGVVASNDVVVIKINNQWGNTGDGDGFGRLSTNTDVLKGLIWRIVQHPDGFTGEIVIAENTQGAHPGGWNDDTSNSQDQAQSYQDVVDTFNSLGYPVSVFGWDDLNSNLLPGGDVNGGYPTSEYINGNMNDGYVLLEDPAGQGVNELSYPKFRAASGRYISMRYGIWDGSSYDSDRLTLINLPVLKKHGMAGATIAWKNYIGFLTISNHEERFNYGPGGWSWDQMHGFFWGYQGVGDTTYGGLGRQLAFIRASDLNIVDAIWVAIDANYYGTATRQNMLLASRDPFAVDWYASEYVLRLVVPDSPNDSSAARGGIFRTATRVNQRVAQAVWPEGNYPYMHLLSDYDGETPTNAEKNQMNVYIAGGQVACQAITSVTIDGPTTGEPGAAYTFTTTIAPISASQPITYTWDNADSTASSQRTFDAAGTYDVNVSAVNSCGGPVSDAHSIEISEPQVFSEIYLPLVQR